MRLTIAAVGRLKSGPEHAMLSEYLDRATATGRQVAIGPAKTFEIDERKARDRPSQAERLLAAIPDGATAIALDERGQTMTSPKFAHFLGRERDAGCQHLVFLIGGADGLDERVRSAAAHQLSFGPMVWPHMLARVMLAEQIYRATSILAGSPYHRA